MLTAPPLPDRVHATGPRLNVVVGPNGSGKSSIVCALALGLAGRPNVLGRAAHLHEFIRRGADEAFVEIELSGGGNGARNHVVRRTFNKSNQSTWLLDGARVTQEKVKTLLNSLNIMVDNLCQFLPQDKVASFSGLDSMQLLRETEKAVQRPGLPLLEMHDALCALKTEAHESALATTAKEERVADLEAKNKSTEKVVHLYRRRERLVEELSWLEKKLPWMRFETVRNKAIRRKEQLQQATDE